MNRFLLGLLLLCLISLAEVHGQLDIKHRLRALTKTSDIVLIGRIDSITSRVNDQRTSIHSYITITAKTILKGDATTQSLVLETVGGRVGNTEVTVSHSVRYNPGEEILIFLSRSHRSPHAYFHLTGPGGKFNIVIDTNGERVVFEDTGDEQSTNEQRRLYPMNLEETVAHVIEYR